jgi:hypothetical protein
MVRWSASAASIAPHQPQVGREDSSVWLRAERTVSFVRSGILDPGVLDDGIAAFDSLAGAFARHAPKQAVEAPAAMDPRADRIMLREAASALGVEDEWVRHRLQDGLLPGAKLDGVWWAERAAVDELIAMPRTDDTNEFGLAFGDFIDGFLMEEFGPRELLARGPHRWGLWLLKHVPAIEARALIIEGWRAAQPYDVDPVPDWYNETAYDCVFKALGIVRPNSLLARPPTPPAP